MFEKVAVPKHEVYHSSCVFLEQPLRSSIFRCKDPPQARALHPSQENERLTTVEKSENQ